METHILFFILAGLLIAILVGYSLWSARREKSRVFSNTFSTRPPSTPINTNLDVDIPNFNRQQGNDSVQNSAHPITGDFTQTQQEVENSIKNIRISLPEEDMAPNARATSPFAEQSQTSFFEQNNTQNYMENAYMEQLQPVEQDYVAQPQVDGYIQNEQATSEPYDEVTQQNENESDNSNIISLYVVAAEGQQFQGNDIVQSLEALGFHYGEYQIFHRHLDNMTSPVLFSVANMMQPGVFDLNTMDQFSTVGLVFFMYLPSAGNDLVNLRLMIRTVERFAESMDGFILDENRQLFDENAREDYLLRVKMPN
ncbi:cell division protein ZipA [Otariodibacter oris]|uniref:Cell division protein ZipA n=1 Tax=Otariodibacter oris TaxID=1032623 RepID=A0A420XG88_9PAST|nr:cell division protein ZipA [Otariodibacter oris]QGM80313.1 cell division protein ZipA [Otariodibacter oris]RKR71681.1 cell division protein ZipA [Otariodibacter oris]